MDINKGLLLDVFDLYCYDSETNKLLFMSENLTQSSINIGMRLLRNGVMVAQEILVLLVQVRILVFQLIYILYHEK